MKRVLIITYYWPPAGGGGVQRWVKFAAYLRQFDWEPVIFTVKNGDYPILDPSLEKEVPGDIEILREPAIEPYTLYHWFKGQSSRKSMDANFLSQGKKLGWKDRLAVWIRGNFFIPDARRLWVRPSVRRLLSYLVEQPVDAVISSGPPHSCHLIALALWQKTHIPWLVDYRDPWTQIDYFNDLGLTAWARQRHLSLEKKVLNSCDAIITVGKTMAADLAPLTDTQRVVITNGFDESDKPAIPVAPDTAFTITYIGTMNDARNPVGLWRALHRLKESGHPLMEDLEVRLVGKPEAVVRESVDTYQLADHVQFVGYVTHSEAIRYQNSARVLLLVINRTTNNASILTGKIFEYLASGRPILCIGPSDGDAAEIIRQAAAGVVCDYEDEDGMIRFLEQCYHGFTTGDVAQQEADISRFSRRALTGQLAALLDEVSNPTKT